MAEFVKLKAEPTGIISVRANKSRCERWKVISKRLSELGGDRREFNEAVGVSLDRLMSKAEQELDAAEQQQLGGVNGVATHSVRVS